MSVYVCVCMRICVFLEDGSVRKTPGNEARQNKKHKLKRK